MQRWILLRGLTREAAHWQGFDVALGRALPDVHIETHDLPGTGTQWNRPSPATMGVITDDVRKRVREGGDAPVVLVAISLGGMVAIDWIARASNEVAAAVIISSSLGRFSLPHRRLRPSAWAALLRAAISRDITTRESAVLSVTSNLRSSDPAVLRDWVEVQRIRPVTRTTALRQSVAATLFRGPAILPTRPLLLLASRADRLVHPSCTQALVDAYGGDVRWHEHAGHDVPLDDPAWVVGQILAWRGRVA